MYIALYTIFFQIKETWIGQQGNGLNEYLKVAYVGSLTSKN